MVRPSKRHSPLALPESQWEAGSDDGEDGIDWTGGTYTPSTPELDELTNVDTTGKADGDVIYWNAPDAMWEVAPPTGGGAPIEIFDEGVSKTTTPVSIDFVGAGVTATETADAVTVTIPGGSSIAELDDIPDVNAPSPANGDLLVWDSTPGEWVNSPPSAPTQKKRTVNVILGGTASVIAAGIKGDIRFPENGTINSVEMFADQTGSIVVDLWKDTYGNYPPVVGDSITASAKPTISAATKSTDSTLTGWTTSITAGDVIRINVDSVSAVKRVTLALTWTPT